MSEKKKGLNIKTEFMRRAEKIAAKREAIPPKIRAMSGVAKIEVKPLGGTEKELIKAEIDQLVRELDMANRAKELRMHAAEARCAGLKEEIKHLNTVLSDAYDAMLRKFDPEAADRGMDLHAWIKELLTRIEK